MDQPKRKPGSLLQRAFFNQYNYILLGGAALLSAVSGSFVPGVVGVGAEILWLVLGSDSSLFRRWVAKQESIEEAERVARETAQLLASLGEPYALRFHQLSQMGDEIGELAKENKGLETALIKDEMDKLGQLMASFLKMAASHQRLSVYLLDNPVMDIERDIARAQAALKLESGSRLQQSLRQALSLAQKRLRQHHDIESAYQALSVEMDTLEKAFGYIKSHILGIGSREELAAELDNLVTGVASIAELEASTDQLVREARAQKIGQ